MTDFKGNVDVKLVDAIDLFAAIQGVYYKDITDDRFLLMPLETIASPGFVECDVFIEHKNNIYKINTTTIKTLQLGEPIKYFLD